MYRSLACTSLHHPLCTTRVLARGRAKKTANNGLRSRLQELAEIFAVSVGGFSVMDNHMHVLVRRWRYRHSELAWSDEDVVRRWGRLFPPRGKSRQPLAVSKAWVEWRLQDVQWVAKARSAFAEPELVHEMLEGTASPVGQSAGQNPGRVFRAAYQDTQRRSHT